MDLHIGLVLFLFLRFAAPMVALSMLFCVGLSWNNGVLEHIGGIFIILVTSIVGTALPLVFKRFPQLRVPPYAILFGDPC
jgi:hypothetical protein